MKKLVLSLALLFSLMSFVKAQPLTLTMDGNPIGETLTLSGAPTDFEVVLYANVHNNSDHDMNIKVIHPMDAKRQELKMTWEQYMETDEFKAMWDGTDGRGRATQAAIPPARTFKPFWPGCRTAVLSSAPRRGWKASIGNGVSAR